MALFSYRSSIHMAEDRGAFPAWDYDAEKNNPYINRIIAELEQDRYIYSVYHYKKTGRRSW